MAEERTSLFQKIKDFGKLIVDAVKSFLDDGCMRMSASLAYYTVFSIGPLIIILIWGLGFFYEHSLAVSGDARNQVMDELTAIFGVEISNLLESAIQKISLDSKSSIGILIGIGTLIATSTTIFIDIQKSLNEIWRIKPKPKKGWLKMIIDRVISFSMILGLSFLLMASLVLSSLLGALTRYIEQYLDFLNLGLVSLINTGITFIVITTLFGGIYAFLPDAKIQFKNIFGGALFTALLFMGGKYLISLYLMNNATASAYGAAGSIIALLAWVYYSAAILYFGAEFTKQYAIRYGEKIEPASFAVLVKQTELEEPGEPLGPENLKEK
ncbi:MAG TPA: YihY/virulence factor BrkB family protein [Sphingobacterium sp.]|nr:YihY/virulence factor BrkB family protein [Sphingobacterium sp.]